MAILTLIETADKLHAALRDYIEATYHISDEGLVLRRRRLLEQFGVIRQHAYIESTPRYKPGPRFEELGLPPAALQILLTGAGIENEGTRLLHNPPYDHQSRSLQGILVEGRSLMVTTGTGSGKTECFLLPILGRLATQAADRGDSFTAPAIRALVLYPMNALVNDQLGRLRLLFGNEAVAGRFLEWSGRPARFARYTSRTLYPGVRTAKRDQRRLRPIGTYYGKTARVAVGDGSSEEVAQAQRLMSELKRRGKWPAKPDIVKWFGADGSRWQNKDGTFLRCVALPNDPELLTRHEVLAAPPDILVTNYSMLEYMLMRPLERPVFDATRDWLAAFPDERFLLVVDEAHLYRGAAGTEVALLLRRLRDRLGISPERLQVICTSASFADVDRATDFGAKLTGKHPDEFLPVRGELALRPTASTGSKEDAELLASIDLDAFYKAETDARRLSTVMPLLSDRGVEPKDVRIALHEALQNYPPMSLLVNATMEQACRVDELGPLLFPAAQHETSQRAAATLVAFGSYSREPGGLDGPGLLPSRIHAFFRGLPGLWACIDPNCPELAPDECGGPAGALYGQPRTTCLCGARVFELLTCRQCGTAYSRAYTDSVSKPDFLWPESGERLVTPTEELSELLPIDILLEPHSPDALVRPVDLDMDTGRVNPPVLGDRVRRVFLPADSSTSTREGGQVTVGSFLPCAVCGKQRPFGRTYVQDHQTKGDEPFRALITRQIDVQQPTAEPSTFAPLAGRKVLVFSDSRQAAARLAPNLQKYTTQDAIRPLLLYGFDMLEKAPAIKRRLSLEDSYLAVLLASSRMGVRLRPPTKTGETFEVDLDRATRFLQSNEWQDAEKQVDLMLDFSRRNAPQYLLRAIRDVINDPYTGLNSLALASLAEVDTQAGIVEQLPDLEGVSGPDQKRVLLRLWLDSWRSQWLSAMPDGWASTEIQPESGAFPTRFKYILGSSRNQREFAETWLPTLLDAFTQPANSKFVLKGSSVTLAMGGSWAYCRSCRSTSRLLPPSVPCTNCGRDSVSEIDPETDPVFSARKGYYRRDTVEALSSGLPPLALIAAEHTAQLNDAQADEVFSDAEEHELLFQDVDLGTNKPAIDVLSCTTTMEVGIDIGALSGVALRNMPPARANYQQRAGRAGRRSRAVATVTAFAGADSHDDHCFRNPDQVIRGEVTDPELGLDNWQIARRHLTAFLVQEYLQTRLPEQPPVAEEDEASRRWQLFEVLGSVADFKKPDSTLNREDFARWLTSEAESLLRRCEGWLPEQLEQRSDRQALRQAILETGGELDRALDITGSEKSDADPEPTERRESGSDDGARLEVPAEVGEEEPLADAAGDKLLDRLLYRGVLPRYAFPTDVAAFYVFSPDSTPYRPTFRYTPSQGLAVALSQYAPGKTVWIGGKEWRSGAIYSPMAAERYEAWQKRRWYMECRICGYAKTLEPTEAERREQRDCPACGATGEFGPAQAWLRPPGFAHPHTWDERTSPDDEPATSYATRAKLTAPTPAEETKWTRLNEHIKSYFEQLELLVTNAGPRSEGYNYCTRCGLVEPSATTKSIIGPRHSKPFPDTRHPLCEGEATATGVVLGTRFISDVLLVALRVDSPLTLRPDYASTRTALRTLSEALTSSACGLLGIDPSELHAEFRPALTPGGKSGVEAEIYMYDTLPGGAGFAQRAGRLGMKLFEEALGLLQGCPAHCESSCYRCLRSYKNKFDHGDLDRHLGASLLAYLLDGTLPVLDPGRAASSIDLLFEDLYRLNLENVTFEKGADVDVPGIGQLTAPILATLADGRRVVLTLRVPFTSSVFVTPEWMEAAEFVIDPQVLPVDELAVRTSLPRESRQLISTLGLA